MEKREFLVRVADFNGWYRVTGTYSSLRAAVSAAKRQDANIPDQTRQIAHRGVVVRHQYDSARGNGLVRYWNA